ncbi:MAG: protein-glutamate O-methyltransferase CheR [Pseudomonadales bacterium]
MSVQRSHALPESKLSAQEFNEIRVLIQKITGISMNDSKSQLISRRLGGRLAELGIDNFRDYINYLESGNESELEIFSNAVTTNLTSFFRERHHFDYLEEHILPEIETQKMASQKRLRIWSAGCSTGEEPYSIAMMLRESMPKLSEWDAKILATDLDTSVLATCKKGQYSDQVLQKVPPEQRKRWFREVGSTGQKKTEIHSKLKELITFKQLNLMGAWPMQGEFDVIFCRNVIIYFDKPTQRKLIDRYANLLVDGGFLIIGHSESLLNVTNRFSLIGKTIYRKNG